MRPTKGEVLCPFCNMDECFEDCEFCVDQGGVKVCDLHLSMAGTASALKAISASLRQEEKPSAPAPLHEWCKTNEGRFVGSPTKEVYRLYLVESGSGRVEGGVSQTKLTRSIQRCTGLVCDNTTHKFVRAEKEDE